MSQRSVPVAIVATFSLVQAAAVFDTPYYALYKPSPLALQLATFPQYIDSANTSDVALADFDGDGRLDIAVAWYASSTQVPAANQRVLTIFLNRGGRFDRAADLNLYIPDANTPGLSVFRNGTGALAVGDFNGDGRPDLAVLPLCGDELWLIENLGGGRFAQHLKFMFGSNGLSPLTPPRALAADFDGDGRDELVYVADPIFQIDGEIVHIWSTHGAIADMSRVYWEPLGNQVRTKWIRSLAVADFDGDGRPDLCFCGATDPTQEQAPILTFWYGLDLGLNGFRVTSVYPASISSDLAVVPVAGARPTLLLTDRDGATMHWWTPVGGAECQYVEAGAVTGYAALSPNRGMSAAVADINGDGKLDLITKQKLGDVENADQIEITFGTGAGWELLQPTPIDTSGWTNEQHNEILRPHNLAVGDLLGNTLPEIVGGFAARGTPDGGSILELAIWQNACTGDVNRDGVTDAVDFNLLLAAAGTCRGEPRYNADADLDKDGCITANDAQMLLADLGCNLEGCQNLRGDMNCDCVVDMEDIAGFVLALVGQSEYSARYPHCNWLNADINGDGRVDLGDINDFVALLGGGGFDDLMQQLNATSADGGRAGAGPQQP